MATIYWLFHVYGKRYDDTRLAVMEWLDEEHDGGSSFRAMRKKREKKRMYDKPWQNEDDPEKAILLALQEIAEVTTVEDDLLRNERIIRFCFKRSYNPARYYAQGSVE